MREVREVAAALGHGEVAVRVGVEVRGEAARERHDRQRRVDRERARDERAVADVEPLDVPGLRVGVDDRARRVAAHAARPLHVRRERAPSSGRSWRPRPRSTLREKSSAPSMRSLLARVERRRERLGAVLVELHAAVVVVVRPSRAAPIQRRNPRTASTSGCAPQRAVLVLERRREADRILDRRRLDHEAAVLVVLVAHRVRGDRIDHVRVLRLVEEPVDEARRVEAEVAADQPAARAVGQARAQQQLRRVERARRRRRRRPRRRASRSRRRRRTRRRSPRRPRSRRARRARPRAARAGPAAQASWM